MRLPTDYTLTRNFIQKSKSYGRKEVPTIYKLLSEQFIKNIKTFSKFLVSHFKRRLVVK